LKDQVFGEWIGVEEFQADSADAMSLELDDFKAAIRGEHAPRVSGKEGVEAMIVADQVLEALNLWSYQTSSAGKSTAGIAA
jgi:hypothetical protein